MPVDARAALKQHFGFETFRPGQEAVVAHLMAGHSAAAVFPTGGGKSLCYQLPALLLPGLTLVVSPLVALMKDQIDALTRRGIVAARLDSTLDAAACRAVMEQVRRGTLRLLYVAPERFNNERFREAITPLRISLFANEKRRSSSDSGRYWNSRPGTVARPPRSPPTPASTWKTRAATAAGADQAAPSSRNAACRKCHQTSGIR